MTEQQQQQQPQQQGGRIVVCHRGGTARTSTLDCSNNRLEQRYTFEYNGQRVYDFEQTLDEMKLFVKPPSIITSAKQISCMIGPSHLQLGLVVNSESGSRSNNGSSNSSTQPQKWYLDEDTYDLVDVDESTWTLEDDDDGYRDNDGNNSTDNGSTKVIVIYLTKARRGLLWEAPLKGNPEAVGASDANSVAAYMDPIQKEQMKQSLLLLFHLI